MIDPRIFSANKVVTTEFRVAGVPVVVTCGQCKGATGITTGDVRHVATSRYCPYDHQAGTLVGVLLAKRFKLIREDFLVRRSS